MEIQVLKFRNALGLLDSAVPKKPSLEILKCVLLQNGHLIATDFEKAVSLEMPEIEGEALLPFREVTKLLRYVPGNETLQIGRTNGQIVLTWSAGKAAYNAMPLEDYPALPRLDHTEIKQTILGDHFVSGLLSVVGYCAEDDTRPVLNG